jgi:DNA-binding NarL/FixJ family response regulator
MADKRTVTGRERQVLDLVAEGKSNREIAEQLGIQIGTAKAHVSNLLHKLGFKNMTELATWWQANKPGDAALD